MFGILWDPKSRKTDLSVGIETVALEYVRKTMAYHSQATRFSLLSNQTIRHFTVFVSCTQC